MSRPDDVRHNLHQKIWQKTWFWVVAWFLFCALAGAACCLDVPGFVSGETDILGNYRFEEEQEEARSTMTPMERIHAETFPEWLIAEANRRPEASEKYQALRAALQDETLRSTAEELKGALDSGAILRPPEPEVAPTRPGAMDAGPTDAGADAGTTARPAPTPPTPVHIQLLQRWNDRLEELGEPFYVTGSISTTRSGPALLCEFYRRLGSPSVRVGEREHPTIILQRIDRTNIVEAYLGVARQGDRALVVTDRILDLAKDQVWLILNPDTEPSDPLASAYASAIREEATQALGAETVSALTESAANRAELLDVVDSVMERRSCGSTMRFGYIPWDGLDPRELDRLEGYAERDKIQPCPAMEFDEVDALRETSAALQSDENKRALQRMVAWLTRIIALHEARHAADQRERGNLEGPSTCPGCPEPMRRDTRAELSAYVASIAWSDSPAVAIYQACTIRRGPHRRAVWFLNEHLGRSCDDPPPDDLAEQAREAQRALFGHAESMELPADFPDALDIHRFR